MASVKVVTGYVEIPGHPRGSEDYRALGEQLLAATAEYETFVFDHESITVNDTWLASFVKSQPNITHSVADNPAKNTMDYHCVQHAKFEWLRHAAQADTAAVADTYVWIDYGIMHVPGVTAEVIQKFLTRAGDYGQGVLLPGCWPKKQEIPHDHPCWRFCGGLFTVPAALVKPFTTVVMSTAVRQIMTTRNVEWEVNTLARVELANAVPMLWYKADHNETMFTGAP